MAPQRCLNLFPARYLVGQMSSPILWSLLGSLGAVLGRLGAILRLSWVVLGAPDTIWEPSWAVLRPSWAILGLSWAVLGAPETIWGPSWAVLGPSWAMLGLSWAVLGQDGIQRLLLARLLQLLITIITSTTAITPGRQGHGKMARNDFFFFVTYGLPSWIQIHQLPPRT